MPLVELTEEQIAQLEKKSKKGEKIQVLTELDDMIGHAWFFRTVTYFLVGKVTKRIGQFLLLEEASWVADTGRFNEAIKNGTLSEVEPVGPVMVNLSSIVDAYPWAHKLPTDVK